MTRLTGRTISAIAAGPPSAIARFAAEICSTDSRLSDMLILDEISLDYSMLAGECRLNARRFMDATIGEVARRHAVGLSYFATRRLAGQSAAKTWRRSRLSPMRRAHVAHSSSPPIIGGVIEDSAVIFTLGAHRAGAEGASLPRRRAAWAMPALAAEITASPDALPVRRRRDASKISSSTITLAVRRRFRPSKFRMAPRSGRRFRDGAVSSPSADDARREGAPLLGAYRARFLAGTVISPSPHLASIRWRLARRFMPARRATASPQHASARCAPEGCAPAPASSRHVMFEATYRRHRSMPLCGACARLAASLSRPLGGKRWAFRVTLRDHSRRQDVAELCWLMPGSMMALETRRQDYPIAPNDGLMPK